MAKWQPNQGKRVHSTELPGLLGRIVDWQPANQKTGQPERWLVKPEKPGELSRWMTAAHLRPAPESKGWTR